MKKIFEKAAAVLTCVFLLAHSIPVYAAEAPVIEMKSGEIKEGDTQVRVSCEISGKSGVTSGKIRIKYDGEKLKLESASAGKELYGAMCEINDCLNGNKSEGEIVVAFAATTPLSDGGSLVEMSFQLDSGVKAGDKLEVTAGAEQLASDGEDVMPEVRQLSAEVGSANEPAPNPIPGDDGNQGDDGNGGNGGNQGDNGNDGKLGNGGNIGGSGNQNDNGSGGGDGNQGNGVNQSGDVNKPSGGSRNGENGGTPNTENPKTGDPTNAALPAAVSGIALMSIVVLLVLRKKFRS